MKSTKEMIEVMQAFEEGKVIQFWSKVSKDWNDATAPIWDWSTYDYRIKPEPVYRPYKNAKEMIADYWARVAECNPKENERPLIWVRVADLEYLIHGFDFDAFSNIPVYIGNQWISTEVLFKRYSYLDGTPCGKLLEE